VTYSDSPLSDCDLIDAFVDAHEAVLHAKTAAIRLQINSWSALIGRYEDERLALRLEIERRMGAKR
jgi:hypothetical protein